MKKIFLLLTTLLFAHLCFAYPVGNAFPPFQIAGNLYYVGTEDLASYLVVTPKGNIIINSNLEANVPMIKNSVEELGFKFSDTKIVLISHAHLDHAAGSQLIKQETGAKYAVMEGDVSVVESGGLSDFHYGKDPEMYFPATKVDHVLHDGDTVSIGGTTLTAHLTAGHTKGCTSWSMKVRDQGNTYDVVMVGSLNVNPGYKLVHNAAYPTIVQDFKAAINKLKALPCDIFLGAHAGYFDLDRKYALINQGELNPFVDAEGYKNYIAQKESEFYRGLAEQGGGS